MKCKSCGTELGIDEKICPSCGTPVEEEEQTVSKEIETFGEIMEETEKKMKTENLEENSHPEVKGG